MIPVSPNRPLPLGELLEQLRLENFAITPDVYDRCFIITTAYFPEGVTKAPERLQELKELLGPVVARSEIEQEKFGQIFDRLLTIQESENADTNNSADLPGKPRKKNGWVLGLLLTAIVVVISLVLYNYLKKTTPEIPPETAGSTRPPTTNPTCLIDVTIKSIQGNTVTFLNKSPGMKLGYRYQWNFSDGAKSTLISTDSDSIVIHKFVKLDTSASATISISGKGECNSFIIRNIYTTNNQPINLKTFPLIRAPIIRQTTYNLNTGYILLAILLGTGVVAATGFRFFHFRQKTNPGSGPPYFLTFPDQEKAIKVAESMDVWARQLNQRDESQRRVMNISQTIRATARSGGYPAIYYQQIKVRPRYLVLIDNRSTFHQQARLYAYLGKVLTEGEVELETFFFNADPRTCWNEKYPKGIAIGDMYRLHRSSYLVLISEGIRLIDYDNGTVAPWVTSLFDGWENRAILTPVYPENWTSIEAILSRFFIVLPATPDGQLLLRTYFQTGELPTFQELLRRFQVNPELKPDRGFFGKSPDKLAIADIEQFLDKPFDGENPTEQEKNILKTWAYATALYPTPTWEMTLAIGRSIERYYTAYSVVTTTNLLKITALPWLQQSKIPENLRKGLLEHFESSPPELKYQIHQAILELLESVKTTPGSLAEEERELTTYEVWLTDEKYRQAGLRKLAPFQKAGLINDKLIDRQVAAYSQRLSRAYLLTLAIVAAFLFMLAFTTLSPKTTTPPTGLAGFVYTQDRSFAPDSAVIYNNMAATVSRQNMKDTATLRQIQNLGQAIGLDVSDRLPKLEDSLRNINREKSQAVLSEKDELRKLFRQVDYDAKDQALLEQLNTELYNIRLAFLMASLRTRTTFEAFYNLHALRYQLGYSIASELNFGAIPVRRALSPLGEAKQIVSPTSWFTARGFVPQDSALENYIKLLNQAIPIDSLRTMINALDTYGANVRQYSGSRLLSDQEISRAKEAARFNRINILLPNARDTKNVVRVRIPRIALSASRVDSLARLDAARIKLFFREQLMVVPEKPATSRPATTKKQPKSIGRKTTRKSDPAPTKARPYSAPTTTGSEEPPATVNPKQENQTSPAAVNPKQENQTLPATVNPKQENQTPPARDKKESYKKKP